jgi:hypothetical protein
MEPLKPQTENDTTQSGYMTGITDLQHKIDDPINKLVFHHDDHGQLMLSVPQRKAYS